MILFYALLILLILIIILFIVVYYFNKNINNKVIIIINGEKIKVYKNYEDRFEAAKIISELNSRSIRLIKIMKIAMPDSKEVSNLKVRYNPGNFEENNKSFTINKGKEINIKLRNDIGELYDINFLTFVMLHELTHIAIDEKHHPPKYWITFKNILELAAKNNIYIPTDYSKNPIKYGKILVQSSPLFS